MRIALPVEETVGGFVSTDVVEAETNRKKTVLTRHQINEIIDHVVTTTSTELTDDINV